MTSGSAPAPPVTAATAAKAALRERVRQRRDTLPAAQRTQACDRMLARCLALPRWHAADTIFIYLATATEVATRALVDAACAAGKTVLVPRIAGREPMHAVPFPGWAQLQPGVLGILSPPQAAPDAATDAVDLVIVPGLAFSADGARLGYGGGYYDRWLAAHPRAYRLALCFDIQVEAQLPLSPHDLPVHQLLTESRDIRRLNAPQLT